MNLSHALEFTLRFGNEAKLLNAFSILAAVRAACSKGRKFDIVESPDMGMLGALVKADGLANTYAVRLHTSFGLNNLNQPTLSWSTFGEAQRNHAIAADVITVPTFSAREAIAKAWGVSLERAVVIPNPVKRVARSSLASSQNYSGVMFGRLVYEKGIDIVAKVVGRIRNRVPQFTLHFVGPDLAWSEEENASDIILKLASMSGGQHSVFFHPPMRHTDLIPFVRRHNFCVFPSRNETFGLALAEAISWGVPSIASNIPPFVELVGSSNCCIFAETENVDSFYAAMIYALENPNLIPEMVERGLQTACRWYPEQVVDELLKAWTSASLSPAKRKHARQ